MCHCHSLHETCNCRLMDLLLLFCLKASTYFHMLLWVWQHARHANSKNLRAHVAEIRHMQLRVKFALASAYLSHRLHGIHKIQLKLILLAKNPVLVFRIAALRLRSEGGRPQTIQSCWTAPRASWGPWPSP